MSSRDARRIVLVALLVFCAYVVGRAAGILLGIGPYATEAVAIAVVLILVVRRWTRRPMTSRRPRRLNRHTSEQEVGHG